MYNNLDELFELKKAKIQYDFDSKNYAGVYYPGIHELEVNVNKITYPQAVISYIHESLHYIAHEKDLGVFQFDYLILYLELTYFSSIYKYNIISDYLTNKNIIDEPTPSSINDNTEKILVNKPFTPKYVTPKICIKIVLYINDNTVSTIFWTNENIEFMAAFFTLTIFSLY